MAHDGILDDLDIAVLLPCYNEAATIGAVVAGFRAALPGARIHVYDNNSTDGTALTAMLAGATVVRERRQGKGHVVRRMFCDIDADIYIMADGDGTYDPEEAQDLIRTLLSEGADMVVGTRRGVTEDAGRQGHAFGNAIFNKLYRTIFGTGFSDIFSGYRAFSRRFAKSFPAVSRSRRKCRCMPRGCGCLSANSNWTTVAVPRARIPSFPASGMVQRSSGCLPC
mgnify:CR=1 FL=1